MGRCGGVPKLSQLADTRYHHRLNSNRLDMRLEPHPGDDDNLEDTLYEY